VGAHRPDVAEMSAAVATGEKAFGVDCPHGPGLAGEADPEPGVLDDAASRLLATGCADPFGTGPDVWVHTGIRQRPGIIGCLRPSVFCQRDGHNLTSRRHPA
jgi:hypothetical protein